MSKAKYTPDIHYKNLKKMMRDRCREKDRCDRCPLEYDDNLDLFNNYYTNDMCAVCRRFIKLRKIKRVPPPECFDGIFPSTSHFKIKCPCLVLGKKEAMRRTREALKEFKKT